MSILNIIFDLWIDCLNFISRSRHLAIRLKPISVNMFSFPGGHVTKFAILFIKDRTSLNNNVKKILTPWLLLKLCLVLSLSFGTVVKVTPFIKQPSLIARERVRVIIYTCFLSCYPHSEWAWTCFGACLNHVCQGHITEQMLFPYDWEQIIIILKLKKEFYFQKIY